MVVPFVVLLSTTGLNGGTVKLKKKRLIKHVVTISVTISILLALVIVAGILLAFELPPRNEKSTLKKINNWKHQVHAVFAINLVGPKETRLRRSIENVKVTQFILV
uniref:Amino acid transporter n=1 Tax=Elaeophora elaphi TaxID=1147741 RepID=A0A0R3RPZ1_9BILA